MTIYTSKKNSWGGRCTGDAFGETCFANDALFRRGGAFRSPTRIQF